LRIYFVHNLVYLLCNYSFNTEKIMAEADDFAMLMDVAKYIAKSAEATKRSGSATAFALAESFKEKLVYIDTFYNNILSSLLRTCLIYIYSGR
jgi:hypothetical protein